MSTVAQLPRPRNARKYGLAALVTPATYLLHVNGRRTSRERARILTQGPSGSSR